MSTSDFNIIFAGGGTAGCLIAGRLASADLSLRILVLEAGPHTRDLDAHIQPGRYYSHLAPTSLSLFLLENVWAVVAASTVVMVYTRAAASDYDDWETVYGNLGWGSKDLIPLLKKTETYQVKPGEPTHGYSGPLRVSYGGGFPNVSQQFLDVASRYDPARGVTADLNGLFSCNQYGRWQKWIDAETGKRSDVAHHFIYNQSQNQNLEVRTSCHVKRVIFENMRAVGVEYVNDTADADPTVNIARASRLVVLSAGAFGTPTILERSGIGSTDILKAHGVQPLVDLPGVGQNYQDHNGVIIPYLASEEAETICAFMRGEKAEAERLVAQWKSDGTGMLASNFLDAVIWIGSITSYPGDPSNIPARKYFGIGYYSYYPISRGEVHISSGDNALAPSEFESDYLRDLADLATLRWGYKKSRELARRFQLYRGEYVPGHPTFTDASAASCHEEVVPVDISAQDIAYTKEDDAAIENFHRNSVQTMWHSLGTCAMKSKSDLGVVDERLNVYGVQGLKVAGERYSDIYVQRLTKLESFPQTNRRTPPFLFSESVSSEPNLCPQLSITPGNVAANTYSTALVIGEKAAVLIAEELGITL
ncbi:GMC oxidoreductase [Mycena venus]|uniref:GMC oxidoreductase n=1 Tax=Mycena venus TaxID=2733690 RepID=A0A8H7D0A7_9AGAR|nr:GMC oxidoreductase [Mycena venus]